jgi:post-segregation antitoxin (ccd killing protein)
MPKVSIYIPDALYSEIRRRELPLSQVAQRAFAQALADDRNQGWIAAARRRPARTTTITTEELMADVDAEFEA